MRGRCMRARRPPSCRFSSMIAPPWPSAIALARVRPRPVPPVSALRELSSRTKGSNTRDAVVFGNAGAFVLDHDVVAVAAVGDLDIGLAAIGDRILDQVAHRAADFVGPASDGAGAWVRQVTGSPISSRSVHRLSTSADRSTLRLALAAGAARRRQHLFGQFLQFVQILLQAVRAIPRPATNSRLMRMAVIGRAQIVAHRRKKMALAFQGARHLIGHALKAMAALRTSSGPFSATCGARAAARHHRGGRGQS